MELALFYSNILLPSSLVGSVIIDEFAFIFLILFLFPKAYIKLYVIEAIGNSEASVMAIS
jgi:hypothetical protein